MRIVTSQSEFYQEFDLADIFGLDVSTNPEIGMAFGQDIIDLIVERTESGKSMTGRSFPKYSDEYKKSLQFKAWGKSGKVDLTLTGSMLLALDILEFDGNNLKVGMNDESQIPKAYNHQIGDTVPQREFFGVTEKEILELKDKYQDAIDDLTIRQEMADLSDLSLFDSAPVAGFRGQQTLNNIFDLIEGED